MLQGTICLLDISVAGKNEIIVSSFTLLYCCQTLLVTPYFLAPTLYCIVRYMSRKTLFRGAGNESFAEFIPPLPGL